MTIHEKVLQFVLRNPTAVATLVLAIVTTVSVVEYSRGSIRQAIATAESQLMPRLNLNTDPDNPFAFIHFQFLNSRPQTYEVSTVDEDHPNFPTVIERGRGAEWTVRFERRELYDYLQQFQDELVESMKIKVDYKSATGRKYSYVYQLHFTTEKIDDTYEYSLGSVELTESQVPWEKVTILESLLGLKSLFAD